MKTIHILLTILLGVSLAAGAQNKTWENKTKFKRPKSFLSLSLTSNYKPEEVVDYGARFSGPIIRGLNLGAQISHSGKGSEQILGTYTEWVVMHNHYVSIYLNNEVNYHHRKPGSVNNENTLKKPIENPISAAEHGKYSTSLGTGIEYRIMSFGAMAEYHYNIILEEPSLKLGLKYNINAKRLGEFRDIPDAEF
jgi:hypothetical protein